MKHLFLVILLFSIFSCKEQSEETMVEQFITDVFNEQIKPETIVEKYIEIDSSLKTTMSYNKRKEAFSFLIKETRVGKGKDGIYAYPNYALRKIKSPKAYKYKDYKHLNTIHINDFESVEDRVYVVLDSEKKKIMTYILLNETKNKILSFSVLTKGNTAYFIQL